MSVLAMLGFDNMGPKTITTNDAQFPVMFPALLKTPTSDKNISLLQYVGTNIVTARYALNPDPDGVQTMTWAAWAGNAPSVISAVNQYLIGPPIAETTLDKTGVWNFGIMVFVPSIISNGLALAVIGDMDTPANNKTVLGSNVNSGKMVAANNSYYVEFSIDWVNKTVKGYVDGVLTNSTTFATTPIAYVGHAQTTQYLAADNTSNNGWLTTGSYLNNPTYAPAYSHVYFAIDKANDPAPTGRLGPVRVRNTPVTAVDTVGDMSTSAADYVTAANTAVTLGAYPTNRITMDSTGKKGIFHFAPPVLGANEMGIAAVQLEVFTYKERDAAANAVFSFGDGTNSTPDFTVISTETQRRDLMCLNAPWSGGAWTPTEVGKLVVKLGSVRN